MLDKKLSLNKKPPTHTLTRLAELVLTLNAFLFSEGYYREIGGVAMGSKMGPTYACLYVGYITFIYIHDVVGCEQCSRHDLEQYIDYVSNFHPALQFTSTISELELPFLDIKLSMNGDKLQCTTRKLTRIIISITRHSILITVGGQFPAVNSSTTQDLP